MSLAASANGADGEGAEATTAEGGGSGGGGGGVRWRLTEQLQYARQLSLAQQGQQGLCCSQAPCCSDPFASQLSKTFVQTAELSAPQGGKCSADGTSSEQLLSGFSNAPVKFVSLLLFWGEFCEAAQTYMETQFCSVSQTLSDFCSIQSIEPSGIPEGG